MASKGSSDDFIIRYCFNEVKSSELFHNLVISTHDEIVSGAQSSEDFSSTVAEVLSRTGWTQKIRNEVFKIWYSKNVGCANGQFVQQEPLDYLRAAQLSWEKKIKESLLNMCYDKQIELPRKRTISEQKELSMRWNNLRSQENNVKDMQPVYDCQDLLEAIAEIRSPNFRMEEVDRNYSSVVQVPLRGQSIPQLKQYLSELKFEDESAAKICKEKLGKRILNRNDIPISAEFLKHGCPVSQRTSFWTHVLGIEVSNSDKLYYEQLKAAVFQVDLIVDHLIFKEVKLVAGNSDQYFVFEDHIHQVMLIFSRDSQIWSNIGVHENVVEAQQVESNNGDVLEEKHFEVYPPSGIIPCHGFSMYVSPLCYVFKDPVTLYFVFRVMYYRYFHHLHTVSSHSKSILTLSVMFEEIIQQAEPELFRVLNDKKIAPLKITFKWLMRAFCSFLNPEQLLHLWDRILAFDSLCLLPLLAAAIVIEQKNALMEVKNLKAAESLFSDLSSVDVCHSISMILSSFNNVAA